MVRLEQLVCLFVHVEFHSWYLDLNNRYRLKISIKKFHLIIILVPFLIKSRRPFNFSSTFVCVRSVLQIATSSGWCFSLKARSVDETLLIADGCCWCWCVEDFSSRVSRWVSFSRWASFSFSRWTSFSFSRCVSLVERATRCSVWLLQIHRYPTLEFSVISMCLSYLVFVLLKKKQKYLVHFFSQCLIYLIFVG